MGSTPASFAVPEQRRLAVVVFTDVAGFSARMETAEASVLQLLERDFAIMRDFSQEMSGTVLKSTGDGLLIYFGSAVHAVQWALRTQRHFAQQAGTMPHSEILRHRVGIHLGDVFVGADDVMGDGVNIAARVQAEAPPGGICISQMVYEVVKNKMELNVVRLEPRKVKNIREPLQMYHVLLQPPAPMPPPASAARPAPAAVKIDVPDEAPTSSSRKVAATVCLLLLIGAGTVLVVHKHFEHEQGLAESQATRAALKALPPDKAGRAGTNPPPARTTTSEGPTRDALAAEEFDFAKMTLERPAGGTAANEPALRRAAECIEVLDAWRQAELRRDTRSQPPLLVRPPGSFQSFSVFTNNGLWFMEGGASRERDWQSLQPEMQGAIVLGLLRRSPTPPSRSVVRGAEAFAYVNGLPAMAETLLREWRGRAAAAPDRR